MLRSSPWIFLGGILVVEFLLFYFGYYYVVGTKAGALWFYLVLLPTILVQVPFGSRYSFIRYIYYGLIVFITTKVLFSLLGMYHTKKDIEQLLRHLSKYRDSHQMYPSSIMESGYQFEVSTTQSRIHFYSVNRNRVTICFHVGDPSVAYTYFSSGLKFFDDD